MSIITIIWLFNTQFSIEGNRVTINEANHANCEVIISNAEEKDHGKWKFTMIYKDGARFVSYKHEALLNVTGNKFTKR